MKLNEVALPNATLYHVTFTKKIPAILKQGITHFNPSNWVQAGSKERYGEGDIYAFSSENDALRWAGKTDWDFHKKMGSGEVSIVVFKANANDWKVDTADPIGQASAEGKWLKSYKAVKPEDIQSHYPVTAEHLRKLVR